MTVHSQHASYLPYTTSSTLIHDDDDDSVTRLQVMLGLLSVAESLEMA
jgi:hypothetical protein